MSCESDISPVCVYHEKDDSPSAYLGFRDCESVWGPGQKGGFLSFNSIDIYIDNGSSCINNSTSNQSLIIVGNIKSKFVGIDDYGKIIVESRHYVTAKGGGTSSVFKNYCCDGASECVEGTGTGRWTDNGEYLRESKGWDPCYRWPNGYRGTYTTDIGRSYGKKPIFITEPCGSKQEGWESSCSIDVSSWPIKTSPEHCVFVGQAADCNNYYNLVEYEGECNRGMWSSSYQGRYSNRVSEDTFYSTWMKKSAKKILEIKESNDKKNCCPGTGFPRPCDRNDDWYDYPYSRPANLDAPEDQEFSEEFLDGNCWQNVGDIEIKNPKIQEFGRKIQAFKFQAAVDISSLNEYEQSETDSRSGEIIIYTPDPNYSLNDPEAPTPCCNSCGCFAGKILKTYNFNPSKDAQIKKNQRCSYGLGSALCFKVETKKYFSVEGDDEPLYNEDLYNIYYGQLNQEWDETSPSFIVKACVKIT